MTDTTSLIDEKSKEEKRDWIAENYNGAWEMFIDPVGLYDRIAELEQENEKLTKQLAAANLGWA